MNILDTQEMTVISTSASHVCQFLEIIDVIEVALGFHWSFCLDLLETFSQIVETLLGHDSIVSFVSDFWRESVDQVWKI